MRPPILGLQLQKTTDHERRTGSINFLNVFTLNSRCCSLCWLNISFLTDTWTYRRDKLYFSLSEPRTNLHISHFWVMWCQVPVYTVQSCRHQIPALFLSFIKHSMKEEIFVSNSHTKNKNENMHWKNTNYISIKTTHQSSHFISWAITIKHPLNKHWIWKGTNVWRQLHLTVFHSLALSSDGFTFWSGSVSDAIWRTLTALAAQQRMKVKSLILTDLAGWSDRLRWTDTLSGDLVTQSPTTLTGWRAKNIKWTNVLKERENIKNHKIAK